MISCAFCGHANQRDARYCSSCGRSLAESEETTGNLQPLETSPGAEVREEAITRSLNMLPKGVGCLLVRAGEDTGSWFVLEGPVTSIGRHPGSDVFLDDITVSRRHAEILRDGLNYSIKDVGSLNGIYHNKSRVDVAPLIHGDEIQVGKFRFLFAFFGAEF